MLPANDFALSKNVRAFIRREAAAEATGDLSATYATAGARPRPSPRTFISAHDLAAAKPALDAIEDETDRRRIVGYFNIMTKYRALDIISDDTGPLMQRYPKQIAALAVAMTELDRRTRGAVKG